MNSRMIDDLMTLSNDNSVPFSSSSQSNNNETDIVHSGGTYEKRIEKEYKEIQARNNLISEGILLVQQKRIMGNIIGWVVDMTGIIQRSDYFGKTYRLFIIFPFWYPSEPPIIKFCNDIDHEMIDDTTSLICITSLRSENWSSSNLTSNVLIEIQSFL